MRSLNCLSTYLEKNNNKIASLAPIFIFIYLLIGISAYINWFPGSAKFFYASSITGIFARILSTLIILFYSILIFVAFKQKVKVKWLIVFFILLATSFFSIFLIKHSYYLTYKTNLYGFLTSKEINVGYRKLLTMYFSSFSDFIVAFAFIFALPFCFKNKKTILLVTIPVVIFMMVQCGYSLVFEKAKYVKMLSKESDIFSGYDVNIGAMFGDKQEFGAFLTVAFACAILSINLLKHGNFFSKILLCFCSVSLFVFLAVSLLSGCKTATLSNLLICVVCFIGLMAFWFRKKKKLFYVVAGLTLVTFTLFILFLSIPFFHHDGISLKVYNLLYNRFLSKILGSVDSRNYLSLAYLENTSPSFLMFGITKGAVPSYMESIILDGQSTIHTGFTYFYASYGLFGFMVYLFLLFIVVKNILKIFSKDVFLGSIYIGFFIATLVFNISENEILILSSSAPIFIFNLLVVSYPKSNLIFDKKFLIPRNEVYVCEI